MQANSPDCVVQYDLAGRICGMNPVLLGILGLDLAQVTGKLPSEVWPDGRYAEIEEAAIRALKTGKAAVTEIQETDADGQAQFKQIYVVPERNPAGQFIGTIAYGRDINELRDAENKLRHFIDNLPGMAYIFRLSPDGHGSFPFVSAGIEEFFGLTPEDVQHDMMPLHRLVHPDDRPIIEAAFAEAARTTSRYRVEVRVCRPGLPVRWVELLAIPEKHADGSILSHGIMLDITARKQLEANQQEHLRHFESMDRVNLAMHGTNDLEQMMHNVLDVVLSIFDCDRAFLAHPSEANEVELRAPIERAKPEFPGPGTLGLPIPLDDEWVVFLDVTRDAVGPVQFGLGTEHQLPRCLSEQYQVKSQMVMLLHPKLGQAWRFGLHRCAYTRRWSSAEENLFQNVGQRLQDGLTSLLMYRDLSASEKKFRSLAENLPDVIVRYNHKAEILYANHALKQYIGEVADVATGTSPREHHCDGSFEDYAKVLDRVLTSGKPGELEKTATFPNGQPWTALLRMVPEHDEHGEIVGALSIGRDITKRKRLETELQSHLSHLKNMDRINRAMLGTNDLQEIIHKVLEEVLAIFDCDRVFVISQCGPDAADWNVPMECTKPEYPGVLTLGLTVPMLPEVADVIDIVLKAQHPVAFGPKSRFPVPTSATKQFSVQSVLLMALHPKLGKPWLFGLHQCSHPRIWSQAEERLLQEIGLRLQDGLTSLLMYQDLSASEKKFRSLSENLPDNICRHDKQGRTVYVNPALERALGKTAAEMIGRTPRESYPKGEYEDYAQLIDNVIATGKAGEFEKVVATPDGDAMVYTIRVIPEHKEDGEIVGVIGIWRDITQHHREEEAIQLAYHDTLTDLPNRRLLLDRLKHIMSSSKRSRRYVSLLFVDLDNFKPLNDKYGHDVGDLLLIEAARRITLCVRDVDTVSRFGGDEFVVLLSDLDTENDEAIRQARVIAEKIRESLSLTYFLDIAKEEQPTISVEHHCTSSIGVVVVVNHDASAENVLKWADSAMYKAKEAGRDRVYFYDVRT